MTINHLALVVIKTDDSRPLWLDLLPSSFLRCRLRLRRLGVFQVITPAYLQRRHLYFLRAFILVRIHCYQYMINSHWRFGAFDQFTS
jgi:hypothetical protein